MTEQIQIDCDNRKNQGGGVTCKFYADNVLEDCKYYPGKPIGASCIGCKEKCIHAVDAGADIKAADILMNKGKDNGNT